MPTNLTGEVIKDTYEQLLHVDGGPAATEKTVYSANGVATALKVGTGSASVDNVHIDGNTVSTLNENGDLNLTPNGTGSVNISKLAVVDAAQARTALALGTAALDDTGDFATAAQGALADTAVQPGDLGTAAFANTTAFATAAQGTLADSALQPGGIAFGDITDRAHGIFYDLGDQTFTAATPTVVTFDTTGLATGVSVVSNTRITFAAAGVYEIASRLQFSNAGSADYLADVWFRIEAQTSRTLQLK